MPDNILYFNDGKGHVRQVPASKVDKFKKYFPGSTQADEKQLSEIENQRAAKSEQEGKTVIGVPQLQQADTSAIRGGVSLPESAPVTEVAKDVMNVHRYDPDISFRSKYGAYTDNPQLFRDQDQESDKTELTKEAQRYLDKEGKESVYIPGSPTIGQPGFTKKIDSTKKLQSVQDFLTNTQQGRGFVELDKQRKQYLQDLDIQLTKEIDTLEQTIKEKAAARQKLLDKGVPGTRYGVNQAWLTEEEKEKIAKEKKKDVAEADKIADQSDLIQAKRNLEELKMIKAAVDDRDLNAVSQFFREAGRRLPKALFNIGTMGLGDVILGPNTRENAGPLSAQSGDLLSQYASLHQDDRTIAQDIARGTTGSLEFMAQFAATGGIVSGAGKGIGKMLLKQGAKKASETAAKKGAGKAIQVAGREISQTMMQTAIMPSTTAMALEMNAENPGSFLDSFTKAYLSNIVEVGSEKVGQFIPGSKFNLPGSVQKLQRVTGIDGIAGEFLEEQIATIGHAALGDGQGQWSDLTDPRQQLITAGVVSVIQLPYASINAGGYAAGKFKNTQQKRSINKAYTNNIAAMRSALGKEAEPTMKWLNSALDQAMQTDEGVARLMTSLANQNEFDEGQTNTILNYGLSYIAKKGLETAKQEQVQSAQVEAQETIKQVVNPETQSIILAKVPGMENPVQIHGKIILNTDGSVDTHVSKEVFYTDAEGKRQVIDPKFIDIIENVPGDQAIEELTALKTTEVINEQANDEVRPYEPGEIVRFTGDGNIAIMGQIQGIDEDGNYMIAVDGAPTPVSIEPRMIINEDNLLGVDNGVLVDYEDQSGNIITGEVEDMSLRGNGIIVIDGEEVQTERVIGVHREGEAQAPLADKMTQETPENEDTTTGEIEQNVNKTAETTSESQTQITQEGLEVTPEQQREQLINSLPKTKEGEIDYDKIEDDDTFVTALQSEFDNDAPEIVEEYRKQAEKKLKDAGRIQDPIRRKRAQKQAKQRVERFQNMYERLNPRTAYETRVADIQSGSIKERESKLGEYKSLRDYLLRNIATGRFKFRWNDNGSNKGLVGELFATKNQEAERKKRISFLNNNGYSPESLAEYIAENAGQGTDINPGWFTDTSDIRSEIIDVLLSHDTPSSMIEESTRLAYQPETLEEYAENFVDPAVIFEYEANEASQDEMLRSLPTTDMYNDISDAEVESYFSEQIDADEYDNYIESINLEQKNKQDGIRRDERTRAGSDREDAGQITGTEKAADDSGRDSRIISGNQDEGSSNIEAERETAVSGERSTSAGVTQPTTEGTIQEAERLVAGPQEGIDKSVTQPDAITRDEQEDVFGGDVTSDIESQQPNTNPTEGQKEAGNYKKAHINVAGFDITIENPKGSERSGTDPSGNKWTRILQSHYGYFKRTKGKDGDQIDVFIGENPESRYIFVVDQLNQDGTFDEHKVMLGYDSLDQAKGAYLENYEKGWKGLGAITAVEMEDFRKWLDSDSRRIKPFSEYKQIQEAIHETQEADQPTEADQPIDIVKVSKEAAGKQRGDQEKSPVRDKEYRYELTIRPFGIGTYPTEGFIRYEDSDGSRYGHIVMDRKLKPQEWSKWDLLPTTEIEQLIGKTFVDSEGDYGKIEVEWEEGSPIIHYFDKEGEEIGSQRETIRNLFDRIESGEWVELDKEGNTLEEPSENFAVNEKKRANEKGSARAIQLQINWEAENGDVPAKRDEAIASDTGTDDVQRTAGYDPIIDNRITNVERILTNQGAINFMGSPLTGPTKINGANDVAFLFKNLESAASENVFTVVVNKDGDYRVLYQTTGSSYQSITDPKMIATIVKDFGATKIWMVHNHPSGRLRASAEDIAAHKRLVKLASIMDFEVMPSIIINLDSGKYAEFDSNNIDSEIKDRPVEIESGEVSPVPVYSFDRQKLYSPSSERTRISSPQDVALFLSQQKRGTIDKLQILILDRSNAITRYFLVDGKLKGSELSKIILPEIGRSGENVIIAGNGSVSAVKSIKTDIESVGAHLLDVLTIKQDQDILNNYKSYADEGLLEGQAEYNKISPDDIRFSMIDEAGFYSTVEKALDEIKQEKGTVGQFKAMLLKNGAKEAEMEWMRWDDQFSDPAQKVTKADIQDWIDENRIEVKEVEKSGKIDSIKRNIDKYWIYEGTPDKLYDKKEDALDYAREDALNDYEGDEFGSQYDEDGDYIQEIGDKVASMYDYKVRKATLKDLDNVNLEEYEDTKYSSWVLPGGKNYKEVFLTLPYVKEQWRDGHEGYDDVENPVVRIRFNERIDSNGERTLFLEEIQQPRKEQVALMPPTFTKPNFFVNLALRGMIRYAAENGFDRIAWTSGEQQAERYDLSKQVDKITYQKRDKGYFVSAIINGKGNPLNNGSEISENNLEEYVGKELAQKIVNGEGSIENYAGNNEPRNEFKELSGTDLKVGGEGMKAFYDRIIPNSAKKLGKPFGADVETIEIPIEKSIYESFGDDNVLNTETGEVETGIEKLKDKTITVQSIPVTSKMKEVASQGMPLFSFEEKMAGLDERLESATGEEDRADIVKSILDEIEGSHNSPIAATVVKNKSELIGLLRMMGANEYMVSEAEGSNSPLHGVYYDGMIIINAETVRSSKSVLKVWAHENFHAWMKNHPDLILPLRGMLSDKELNSNLAKGYHKLPRDNKIEEILAFAVGQVYTGDSITRDRTIRDQIDPIIKQYLDYVTNGKFSRSNPNFGRGQKGNEDALFDNQRGRKESAGASQQRESPNKQRAEDKTVLSGNEGVPGEVTDHTRVPMPQQKEGQSVEEYAREVSQWFNERRRYTNAQPLFSIGDVAEEVGSKMTEDLRKEYDVKYNQFFTRFREAWEDTFLPVKEFLDLLRKNGVEIAEHNDIYKMATHVSGKNDAQLEHFKEHYQKPISLAVNKLEKLGFSYRDIENYVFSKHGIERNEYMRAQAVAALLERNPDATDEEIAKINVRDFAGITALEEELGKPVEEYIKEFEEKAGEAPVNDLWSAINKATHYTLEKQYQTGMMSKDTFDELAARYRFYVPLRGHDAEVAEDRWDYSPDMGTFFTAPLLKAKGRRSRAESPFAYIGQMAHSAITQGNKNTLKQALLRLARKENGGLMSVSKSWYVNIGTQENPIWEMQSAPYNEDVQVYLRNQEAFEARMKQLEENGMAFQSGKKLDIGGLFIKPRQAEQHEVHVYQNGVNYTIFINANPAIARAINGANRKDIVNSMGFLSNITRNMAANFTTRNPLFVMTNFSRDYLYATTMILAKETPKYEKEFQRNLPVAMGALRRYLGGKMDLSKESDRYMYEYLMNGAKTGFSHIFELNRVAKILERESKRGDSKNWKDHGLAVLGVIDAFNEGAENTTRLSVYMTSRKAGRSILQSVDDAKNITVNFNQKGAGSSAGKNALEQFIFEAAGWVRPLFLFTNAAIQSLSNIVKVTNKHPGKMAGIVSSYALLGYISPILAAMVGGDDGEDAYMKLTDWERQNNWCIMLPNGSFLKIPLPHEMRIFHRLGDNIYQTVTGKQDILQTLMDTMFSISDLLPMNPMGAANASWAELSPDAIRPIAQIVTNKNFMGSQVYNKWANENLPGYLKARTNKKGEYYAPNFMVDWFMFIDDKTGGDGVKKGLISLNPDIVNHLLRGYFGGLYTLTEQALGIAQETYQFTRTGEFDLKIRETPLRAFYADKNDLRLQSSGLTNKYYKVTDKINKARMLNKGYIKKVNEGEMSIEEYSRKVKDLDMENVSAIYERIKEIRKMESALIEMTPEEQREAEKAIFEMKKEVVELSN